MFFLSTRKLAFFCSSPIFSLVPLKKLALTLKATFSGQELERAMI